MMPRWIREVKFDAAGLVPAIVQDARNGTILMMAWMNRAALVLTARTGYAHFYSRSRRKMWKKGEESGHVQAVREIRLDCDADVIILRAVQRGPGACHTGHRSCFFRKLDRGRWKVVGRPAFDPKRVYQR